MESFWEGMADKEYCIHTRKQQDGTIRPFLRQRISSEVYLLDKD